MRLLFVTHRYWPFPGGTEVFVTSMAEEASRRGHLVAVYTGAGRAKNVNDVTVTTDPEIMVKERWDLIIVHAADDRPQCLALANVKNIPSPILYMLVYPQVVQGLSHAAVQEVAYIGVSTRADAAFLSQFPESVQRKARLVRHSVTATVGETIGQRGRFKTKFGINTKFMFLSCGGFWRHKGMAELADAFRESTESTKCLSDVTLVLTGYRDDAANRPQPMSLPNNSFIKVFVIDDKSDVADAMADADLYIMNSVYEGFGLVLIEAMLNRTPWISRAIAGAIEMRDFGGLYEGRATLIDAMKRFHEEQKIQDMQNIQDIQERTERAYAYASANRLTANTVDDIEKILTNPAT